VAGGLWGALEGVLFELARKLKRCVPPVWFGVRPRRGSRVVPGGCPGVWRSYFLRPGGYCMGPTPD